MKKVRSARDMVSKRESNLHDEHSWINQLSIKNALTVPDKKAAFQIIKSDQLFEKFHGKLLQTRDPFNRLTAIILKRHTSFNPDLVKKFVKVRTYARLVYNTYFHISNL